jgi:hypothetical protein
MEWVDLIILYAFAVTPISGFISLWRIATLLSSATAWDVVVSWVPIAVNTSIIIYCHGLTMIIDH